VCASPSRYARSVFGIIDLVAVLPTWLALFVPGLHALIDVRLLRLLRLFRILRLAQYVDEYGALAQALISSRRKIFVFLSFVLIVTVVMGTLMYVVEGPANGFPQHPGVGLLGDLDPHHRRLRRHHAQDRPRPHHRLADDADRLGHAGGAHRHRQRGVHGLAHDRPARADDAQLSRLSLRGPRALGALLQGLRRRAAALRPRLSPDRPESRMRPQQNLRFCTSADGTRIAIASIGSGPPLVRAAHWLSHVEHDLDSPVWGPWLAELSKEHTYLRYDQRGCGLSDADIADFSLDAWVADLEAVVAASGLRRFPLIGMSQGGAVAIAYAVRHPEQVSHLVLVGAYARGATRRAVTADQRLEAETLVRLIRLGWGRDNAAFRHVFTNQFIPGGTPAQHAWWNELERLTATPENAARTLEAFHEVDVTALARQLQVPTLVLHARGDARVPFDEGRHLAALIPERASCRCRATTTCCSPASPAWPGFLAELRSFLGAGSRREPGGNGQRGGPDPGRARRAARCRPGPRQSRDRAQLGKSEKTVRNQVSSIFDKLGVRTRAEAIVASATGPGAAEPGREAQPAAAISGRGDNGLMRPGAAAGDDAGTLSPESRSCPAHRPAFGLSLPPERLASLALAGAALFWSGAFIASRALRNDIDPATLTLLRWGLALVAFIPFVGRKAWAAAPCCGANGGLVVALGVTGLAAFHTLTNLAMHTTTALNAILMLSLVPATILVGGALSGASRPSSRQWAGTAVSLLGACILITRGSLDALLGLDLVRGDLWMVAGVLLWTGYSLLLRRRPADLPPDVALMASIVPAIGALLPVALFTGSAGLPAPTPFVIGAVLYIAVFASLIAFSLWAHGVAVLGPGARRPVRAPDADLRRRALDLAARRGGGEGAARRRRVRVRRPLAGACPGRPGGERRRPPGGGRAASYAAWAAALSPAMSILTIFSIASLTRLARALSGSLIISTSTFGRICQLTP
jgi:pimeloyl-ACP methyl ester carboxylesterase/drug/metabolite transporter (DMT)-like permease